MYLRSVLSLLSEEPTALEAMELEPMIRRGESAIFRHSLPVGTLSLLTRSRNGAACLRFFFLFSFSLFSTDSTYHKRISRKNESVLLLTDLLPVPLACKCFLHALLFAWFQVEGVTLDLFDDVLRLHLPLETTKSILQGLALLNTYFRQDESTSQPA